MPTNLNNQLVKYAKEQMNDALRTVIALYEDDCEILYLRDDVREAYDKDHYKQVAASFRIDLNTDIHEQSNSHIGEKISTIHYHGGAFVFQFLHEECHSILLSVEPRVGSHLKSFIKGCQKQI